ncbi:MAG: FkbM family methyltransferase [Thermoleophilaceae bacterium]|nr:FkbM family methyltransferase [Thermoleophilaceae bacterium]
MSVEAPREVSDSALTRVANLVFDVGLHRGEDTAFYLALGYDVVAFEADPDHAAFCRERFAEEIAGGRLRIIEGVIAPPGRDSVTFYRSLSHSPWGTTEAEWASRRAHASEFVAVEIPTVDFADALRRHGVPHFLKIDIEGADLFCLEQLEAFPARPRFVSIESDKFDRAAVRAEFDLLERLGYGRFAVIQQGSIPGTLLDTVDRDGNPMRYRFEKESSGPFGTDIGSWESRERCEQRYDRIFVAYRIFGERGLLRRTRTGQRIAVRLPRYKGVRVPGWHDTHAMLTE